MKVIGRDVSIFSVQLAGFDGTPASGASTSMLGKWESCEATLTKEWSTVSSSDATEPEKRKKMSSWTLSVKGWIDTGGAVGPEAILAADLVIVTFKETISGRTIVAKGGIHKASMTFNADHGKDSLEIEDVGNGNFGGAATFAYA